MYTPRDRFAPRWIVIIYNLLAANTKLHTKLLVYKQAYSATMSAMTGQNHEPTPSLAIDGLTDEEYQIVAAVAAHIIDTRDVRSTRVAACMEGLEHADPVTRQVARIYMEFYIDTIGVADPEQILRDHQWLRVTHYAPGLYWAYGPLHEKIMETGEFFDARSFAGASSELGYPVRYRDNGIDIVDFIYHWAHSRYPDNYKLADVINGHGTRKGSSRLVHGDLRGYNSQDSLVHMSLIDYYLGEIEEGRSGRHHEIDTTICFAAYPDDIKRVLSLASDKDARRLAMMWSSS